MRKKLTDKEMLINDFKKALIVRGVSSNTLKNYLSDLSYFLKWFDKKIESSRNDFDSYSSALEKYDLVPAIEYKKYLLENKLPIKTLNRKLSTLRQFSKFLLDTKIITRDITEGLTNIHLSHLDREPQFLIDYRRHLLYRGVSKNTLKNYLSDVRQFLFWLETQKQS